MSASPVRSHMRTSVSMRQLRQPTEIVRSNSPEADHAAGPRRRCDTVRALTRELTSDSGIAVAGCGQESLIRVAVRVRPLPLGEEGIVEVAGEGAIAIRKEAATGGNEFLGSQQARTEERMFDRVFGPEATQAEVNEFACRPLMQSAVQDGRSATVFVYGATGAGKTHTMFGEKDEAQQGLIYRGVREVFVNVEARAASRPGEPRLEVKVSFLELYNETVRDLLQEGENNTCKVLEDEKRGFVKVTNLREVEVQDADEALRLIRTGMQMRKVESTAANSRSSRSHAVFSLTLYRVEPTQRVQGHSIFQRKVPEPRRLHSRISLIDLAGSERASVTKNVGSALKDGAKINQSLLALANCIDALIFRGRERAETPRRKVPYRDSKLTLLLKGSLAGNGLVSMIANIHPGRDHFEDANNTLEYAMRASVVKAPTIVKRVRERALSLPASLPPSPPASPHPTRDEGDAFDDQEMVGKRRKERKPRMPRSTMPNVSTSQVTETTTEEALLTARSRNSCVALHFRIGTEDDEDSLSSEEKEKTSEEDGQTAVGAQSRAAGAARLSTQALAQAPGSGDETPEAMESTAIRRRHSSALARGGRRSRGQQRRRSASDGQGHARGEAHSPSNSTGSFDTPPDSPAGSSGGGGASGGAFATAPASPADSLHGSHPSELDLLADDIGPHLGSTRGGAGQTFSIEDGHPTTPIWARASTTDCVGRDSEAEARAAWAARAKAATSGRSAKEGHVAPPGKERFHRKWPREVSRERPHRAARIATAGEKGHQRCTPTRRRAGSPDANLHLREVAVTPRRGQQSPTCGKESLLRDVVATLQQEKASLDRQLQAVMKNRDSLDKENQLLRNANMEKDRQIMALLLREGAA